MVAGKLAAGRWQIQTQRVPRLTDSVQLHLLAFEPLDEAPDVVTWPFLRYKKNAEGRSLEAVCSHPLE